MRQAVAAIARFTVIGCHRLVCTENLNPDVMAMESAKDGEGFDASGPLNRANGWRVFVQ
jgi:hypothetical protein